MAPQGLEIGKNILQIISIILDQALNRETPDPEFVCSNLNSANKSSKTANFYLSTTIRKVNIADQGHFLD